jgi:hypothetical protein
MVVRLPVLADVSRPRTRGECLRMRRPCAFIACRHHLADVHIYTDGSITIGKLMLAPDAPEREVDVFADKLAAMLAEMVDTCVLDVIDCTRADELTLEQIGRRLGVTRERIRQIERKAVTRMGREARRAFVDALDDIDRARTRAESRPGHLSDPAVDLMSPDV